MFVTRMLASAAAGGILALGTCAGTAAATTPAPIGHLTVSPAPAAPGQRLQISGACPTPASGDPAPLVQSVTSDVFAQMATVVTLDPAAFRADAIVSPEAATGEYTITATCTNGKAYTLLPVNAPGTPGHDGGGKGTGTHGGTGTGTEHRQGRDGGGGGGVVVTEQQEPQPAAPVWPWLAGGLALAGALGATAYTVGRRQRAAAEGDGATQVHPHGTGPFDRSRR